MIPSLDDTTTLEPKGVAQILESGCRRHKRPLTRVGVATDASCCFAAPIQESVLPKALCWFKLVSGLAWSLGDIADHNAPQNDKPKKARQKSAPEAPFSGSASLAAKLDQNSDGKITRDEYLKFRSDDFARKDKNADQLLQPDEHAHPSFERADADKNGLLSKIEFLAIFEKQFNRIDANGDGEIAVAETSK